MRSYGWDRTQAEVNAKMGWPVDNTVDNIVNGGLNVYIRMKLLPIAFTNASQSSTQGSSTAALADDGEANVGTCGQTNAGAKNFFQVEIVGGPKMVSTVRVTLGTPASDMAGVQVLVDDRVCGTFGDNLVDGSTVMFPCLEQYVKCEKTTQAYTYDQAEAFAISKGGRLPTTSELASMLEKQYNNINGSLGFSDSQYAAVRDGESLSQRRYVQIGTDAAFGNGIDLPDWSSTNNTWQKNVCYYSTDDANKNGV